MIENGESFRHYAKGVESPKGILYTFVSLIHRLTLMPACLLYFLIAER